MVLVDFVREILRGEARTGRNPVGVEKPFRTLPRVEATLFWDATASRFYAQASLPTHHGRALPHQQ